MKECEGDGCQRKSEAVEEECRTSRGQTDMTDHRSLQIKRQGEAICIQFSAQQEASEEREGREICDQTQEFDRWALQRCSELFEVCE